MFDHPLARDSVSSAYLLGRTERKRIKKPLGTAEKIKDTRQKSRASVEKIIFDQPTDPT